MTAMRAAKAAENYESTKDSVMTFMAKHLEAILEHDLFSFFYGRYDGRWALFFTLEKWS